MDYLTEIIENEFFNLLKERYYRKFYFKSILSKIDYSRKINLILAKQLQESEYNKFQVYKFLIYLKMNL